MKAIPTYFICPFTSPDPDVQTKRVILARRLTAHAMEVAEARNGTLLAPFSPVAQYPEMAQYIPVHLRDSHAYWMTLCLAQLQLHRQAVLIPLKGWTDSHGVLMELYQFHRDNPDTQLLVLTDIPQDVDESEFDLVGLRRNLPGLWSAL